jgi:pyruvate/2-oxoglutarate dehydrogenase complex dihydrolipoamide dehydrogenase (E3) component
MRFNFILLHIYCTHIFCGVQSLGIQLRKKLDYDIIVIGGGASGMFAAGTASSFGCKTLLIDKHDLEKDLSINLGGDCTNAACVPSKAIRCAAQVASIYEQVSSISQTGLSDESIFHFAPVAREFAKDTVGKVRGRESPGRIAASPNLDIMFSAGVSFDSSKRLAVKNPYLFNSTYSGLLDTSSTNDSKSVTITGKKFIICTGAGPSIPQALKKSAKKIGLPIHTYRSIFTRDIEGGKSDKFWNMQPLKGERQKVVIVGGGPTACEIAQSLARLNQYADITIIAPSILGSEDIAARAFARKTLNRDGVNIINRRRVMKAEKFGNVPVLVLDDKTRVPVDILVCATGRQPGQNLKAMQLENAGIEWNPKKGIIVDSKLQSVSAKNVFAAGDCASAIPSVDRRAAHAGWTGYHSIQSAIFPPFLIPSDSVHPVVPRVTFMDPEIASVGLTRAQCVEKYGDDGFKYLKASENATDRGDIDSFYRKPDGFVELRVSIPKGEILGATVCSPGASDIVNEIGVAMVNKLTVRDIAKCIHAYPSYGYLMHRVALSLAMSDIWGLLAACGPVGRVTGSIGRNVQGFFQKRLRSKSRKRKKKGIRRWEKTGMEKELDYSFSARGGDGDNEYGGDEGWIDSMSSLSFLEASKDDGFCDAVRLHVKNNDVRVSEKEVLIDFVQWLDSKP